MSRDPGDTIPCPPPDATVDAAFADMPCDPESLRDARVTVVPGEAEDDSTG
jgi:hypothetical protein